MVREGKLKNLLHHSNGQGNQTSQEPWRDAPTRPPLGTINVIFATLGRIESCPSRIMIVARLPTEDLNSKPNRAKVNARPGLSFVEEDKVGTIQPHNDALVVTLRIEGYDVKKVMMDQGSGTKIIYPDLYMGLNLRPEDLMTYSSPLVSFDGKVVIPRGYIKLPIQTSSGVVEVDFIVVDTYSPYTAIVGRPWLHALRAVSSTLHQNVKYPSKDQIEEIFGSQSMARQCLAAAIRHRPEAESLARTKEGL
ncbi:uncharacterized protein LOC112012333 [Quercus suber]|uniref:uncharacterized protein LOC112012333 n=1 Tax=Quercus suber TaxID=58331 RepID=UPI000CE17DBF|nr:uncharacterized protein LOC112012333 [Quercus suber]